MEIDYNSKSKSKSSSNSNSNRNSMIRDSHSTLFSLQTSDINIFFSNLSQKIAKFGTPFESSKNWPGFSVNIFLVHCADLSHKYCFLQNISTDCLAQRTI